MSARSASSAVLTTSAAVGPSLAHAHVERAVALKREAALGIVELHGGDADVEHDAVGRREAGVGGDAFQLAEPALDQRQASVGFADERLARGDGGGIAVDGEHARAGRRVREWRWCSRRRRRCRQ